MNVIADRHIPDVVRLQLAVHADARGHFVESYQRASYSDLLGVPFSPQQHNVSFSRKKVLRGLHYQRSYPQAKLVRVLKGQVLDVVVDLRADSASYARHTAYTLYGPEYVDTQPHQQLWVPAGCAHGFYVLSDDAFVEYSCDAVYRPNDDYSLLWNDPALAIDWPDVNPVVSPKDQQARRLAQIEQAGLLPILP